MDPEISLLFMDAMPFLKDQISWAKEKNSLYLFFDENGQRLNDSSDISGGKNKAFYWNDYLQSLKITPHRRMMNTCHTFAVNCIQNKELLGITLNDIASIMGHRSLRMLIQHYGKYITRRNKNIKRKVSLLQEKKPLTEHLTESG